MIKLEDRKFPWESCSLSELEDMRQIFKSAFPDDHTISATIDGGRYMLTREEAIELGLIRDPSNPLTLRERIRERIRDWHGKRAVYHERKSIGLD